MLEVRVTNQSDADVSVTISQEVSGIGQELTRRIGAGAEETISAEYPGPEAWTILVDDVPVTDSSQWPPDNPTADFLIHISPDGTVEVIDG